MASAHLKGGHPPDWGGGWLAQEEEEDKSTARALHRRLSGGPLHGGHEVTQSARGRVPRKATDLPDFPELVEWLHRATTRLL